MMRRLLTRAGLLVASLSLGGLENMAQAQQRSMGGGAGLSTGSGLSGGSGLGGGSGIAGGSGGGFSGGANNATGFSGGQGGFTGNTQGAAIAAPKGGSGNVIPSASNVFGKYYVNPMSLGMSTTTGKGGAKSGQGTFNQPLYAPATTTGAATGNRAGATTNNSNNSSSSVIGFTTIGMDRSVPFITELGADVPLVIRPPARMHTELKDIVQRSSFLKNKNGIDVAVESGRVVLRGQVTSERERRLVESMLRLTPGVRDVSNELIVNP
jgi:hypothetical protein